MGDSLRWTEIGAINMELLISHAIFTASLLVLLPGFANAATDCQELRSGRLYTGTEAVTKTGKPCLAWSDGPKAIDLYDDDFPNDEGFDGASNYCRNPVNRMEGLYCYYANDIDKWEACNVKPCAQVNEADMSKGCKLGTMGQEYVGTANRTRSGDPCRSWADFLGYEEGDGNFCRNFGDDELGPWCFTGDSHQEFGYCNIPLCSQVNCKHDNDPLGLNYTGKMTVTQDGEACIYWTKSLFFQIESVIWNEGSPEAAQNECRNPDSDPIGLWCFIEGDAGSYNYCEVPTCDNVTDTDTPPTDTPPTDLTPTEEPPIEPPSDVPCIMVSGSVKNFAFMGMYFPQPGLHNGRPYYRHQTCQLFVYWQGARWYMWSSLDDDIGAPIQSFIPADTPTPDLVTEWTELKLNGKLEVAVEITVTAVLCSAEPCETILITVDVPPPTSLGSGRFNLHLNPYHKGRPAYKHEDMGLYVFSHSIECTDFWVVGPVLGQNVGLLIAENATATLPIGVKPSSWKVITLTNEWQPATVTIKCD